MAQSMAYLISVIPCRISSHERSLNSDISAMQLYLRAHADWTERTHVMFPRLDPRQLIDFGLTR